MNYSQDQEFKDSVFVLIFWAVIFGGIVALIPDVQAFFFWVYVIILLFKGNSIRKRINHVDQINEADALQAQKEAEKKRQAQIEETKKPHKYFLETYYSDFKKLADILKTLPDDYPDRNAIELSPVLAKIGLDPHADDWQKSEDIFFERIQPHPIEKLNRLANELFVEPNQNPFYWDYLFKKRICAFRVSEAPALGLHTYGLPSNNHDWAHDSETPIHYLVKPNDRFRHAYILGKTGAGKTTLLKNLITQDIARGDGVIVLSPEGALFDFILANLPTSRIKDLILYDPTDSTPPVVSLNPIHLEDPRDLAREAGAVAGTLARAMGDDLSSSMQTLLLKCAYTLLQLPDSSFQDLRALLKPVSPLRVSLPNSPHLDEVTREYWRDEFDKGGHRRSAEALISRLDAFFMPPLASTMSRASFAFSEALNASRSVFLFDYSRIHGVQQTIIGQLTLSHVLQTLLKRDPQSEDDRIPYHLYIDEFQTFAEKSESAFRDMLNRARKYKMSVTLAHQVTADIPPKLLDVILGNVGTKVCMQVATTDAEYFARQLHVHGYGAHGAADNIERLKQGEAFLSAPNSERLQPVRIAVPFPPLYTGNDEAHAEGYPAFLRRTSKNRHGAHADNPRPTPEPARPNPPTPNPDEDDGIFT